jgi:hypothetical protein
VKASLKHKRQKLSQKHPETVIEMPHDAAIDRAVNPATRLRVSNCLLGQAAFAASGGIFYSESELTLNLSNQLPTLKTT